MTEDESLLLNDYVALGIIEDDDKEAMAKQLGPLGAIMAMI